MSDRVGQPDFDAWVRSVEDRIAALQRGDTFAGTVSVGRLLVGGVYIDDIRRQAGGDAVAVTFTDKATGVQCTLPVPCPIEDVQVPPQLPTITFHFPSATGDLVAGDSDSTHVRQPLTIVGGFVNVTTFTTPFTIVTSVNGTPVITANITQANQSFICDNKGGVPLVPYTDLVSVNATIPGTGNQGVVWHVELNR